MGWGEGEEREREKEELSKGGRTSSRRALCHHGGSFPVRRRGGSDGICVGCCQGWEGFSACGGGGGAGFPAPGVLLAG